MGSRRDLVVLLSAREVVAAGEPFRRYDESFNDPGVALDAILSLRAAQEPLVLRVAATGGSSSERTALKGDWLCEADEVPRRLRRQRWSHGGQARPWSPQRQWLEAWEECEDAERMLRAAADAGLDRRLVVLAACDCARTAIGLVPGGETRPRRAVDTAEAWARGDEMTRRTRDVSSTCSAAAIAAMVAANDLYQVYAADAPAADSVYAAASSAAYAASAASSASSLVADERAAYAAYAASAAAASARAVDRRGATRRMAGVVRARIPTISVLRAVAW